MDDVNADLHPHERLVRGALERLNVDLDIEGYVDCCTDDVVHTHSQGVDRGKVEVLASHSAFALLSHRFARIERLLVSDDSVAVWQTSAGTVAATGGSFEIEVCTIFDVRDNKICAIHEYADLTPVVAAFTEQA
jgi:ketosteroid isomerase-like protein